jgi:hypothetical protein
MTAGGAQTGGSVVVDMPSVGRVVVGSTAVLEDVDDGSSTRRCRRRGGGDGLVVLDVLTVVGGVLVLGDGVDEPSRWTTSAGTVEVDEVVLSSRRSTSRGAGTNRHRRRGARRVGVGGLVLVGIGAGAVEVEEGAGGR